MISIKKNFSLRQYNTFGLNQKCSEFIEYDNVAELQSFIKEGKIAGKRLFQLGCGSNILLCNDFNGTMMHSQIKGIETVYEDDDVADIKVGAGEIMDDFIAWSVEKNLCGAENLSIIPGTVGASAVQNVGAYGVEAKDIIKEVELVCVEEGSISVAKNEDLHFGYRMSRFKEDWKDKYIVTHVTYRLKKHADYKLSYGGLAKELEGKEINLHTIRETIINIRNNKLPEVGKIGSAGSFFKNPIVDRSVYEEICKRENEDNDTNEPVVVPKYEVSETEVKIPAGWMIERCGWKGEKHKGAGVWHKQALILVNNGHAKCGDIIELANLIQLEVWSRFGIRIEPEVIYIR